MVEAGVFTDAGVGWETCMVGADTFTDAGVGWKTCMAGADGMFVKAGVGWEAGVVGTGMFAGDDEYLAPLWFDTFSIEPRSLSTGEKYWLCKKIKPHSVYRKEILPVAT